jgi:hypothetical protein
MSSTLRSSAVASVLERLHTRADHEDELAAQRVRAREAETAARSACRASISHRRSATAGVVPAVKRERWDGLRDLRNETTHISIRHLETSHEVLRVLDLLAGEIDTLFAT